jgi:hypothetical protein
MAQGRKTKAAQKAKANRDRAAARRQKLSISGMAQDIADLLRAPGRRVSVKFDEVVFVDTAEQHFRIDVGTYQP